MMLTQEAHHVDTRTYSVVLRPEPEGGFSVRVPALREIVTYGAAEADALAMAKDAIELVIASRRERNEPIPAPDAPLFRDVTVTIAA
jgi:antitoxin HicB